MRGKDFANPHGNFLIEVCRVNGIWAYRLRHTIMSSLCLTVDLRIGFSHEIRKVRNNVHPGVWSRDRSDPLKFTKSVYGVVDEVIDVANSWLLHRVDKNLLKAMKKEEKKKPVIAVATAAP